MGGDGTSAGRPRGQLTPLSVISCTAMASIFLVHWYMGLGLEQSSFSATDDCDDYIGD